MPDTCIVHGVDRTDRQTIAKRRAERKRFVGEMRSLKQRLEKAGISQADVCRHYVEKTGGKNPAPRLSQLLEGNTMSRPLLDACNELLAASETSRRRTQSPQEVAA